MWINCLNYLNFCNILLSRNFMHIFHKFTVKTWYYFYYRSTSFVQKRIKRTWNSDNYLLTVTFQMSSVFMALYHGKNRRKMVSFIEYFFFLFYFFAKQILSSKYDVNNIFYTIKSDKQFKLKTDYLKYCMQCRIIYTFYVFWNIY